MPSAYQLSKDNTIEHEGSQNSDGLNGLDRSNAERVERVEKQAKVFRPDLIFGSPNQELKCDGRCAIDRFAIYPGA